MIRVREAFILLLALAGMVRATEPVWIDTDPSVMPGGHEVDDGFALAQAFHSPELQIRGVSVVFGNAPLEQAFPIGKQLVSTFAPSIPVYSGAASAADLGRETEASRAMAKALAKEDLTILAIGPATNVATVLKNHPELAKRMKRVIVVAGRRPNQRFIIGNHKENPLPDFNFEQDPEAFRVVIAARVPIVMTGWEVSANTWLFEKDLALLWKQKRYSMLQQPVADWIAKWNRDFGTPGFTPFDTLAVGYVVNPAMLHCDVAHVSVESAPSDRGRGTKPYLVASPANNGSNSIYCSSADAAFKADLLRRLLANH